MFFKLIQTATGNFKFLVATGKKRLFFFFIYVKTVMFLKKVIPVNKCMLKVNNRDTGKKE